MPAARHSTVQRGWLKKKAWSASALSTACNGFGSSKTRQDHEKIIVDIRTFRTFADIVRRVQPHKPDRTDKSPSRALSCPALLDVRPSPRRQPVVPSTNPNSHLANG